MRARPAFVRLYPHAWLYLNFQERMARNNNHPDRNRLAGIIIGLGVAVLLFAGWMKMRGGGGVVPVRAEKIVRQDIANVISTNGRVEPLNNFEAHAPAPAVVKRVL